MLICEQLCEDYCDSDPVSIIPLFFKPAGKEKNKAIDNVFNVVLPKELTKVEKTLGNRILITSLDWWYQRSYQDCGRNQ